MSRALPIVRRARVAEIERIPAIEQQAAERFRTIGLDHVADGPPMTLDALHAASSRGDLHVIEDAGEVCGFAVLHAAGSDAWLEEISVDFARAGRGLGSLLLEAMCELAKERGHRAIALSTFADVPWNAPYYARRGFSVVPPESLSPALREAAQADAERSLPVHRRVVMRRLL